VAHFDAAIDYKSENVPARLKELCPKGIDIFFDNVGGAVLDAALARLAMRGRVEGFLVLDYLPRAAEAVSALAGWVHSGQLKTKVDVQHGLENAPATLD
jgi:NADPH-dependent curcumin reductase